MKISYHESEEFYRVLINDYDPVVKFSGTSDEKLLADVPSSVREARFEIAEADDRIRISMDLPISAHILGLGERANGLDRKRKKFRTVNTDPGGYTRNTDPIYFPIPFFLQVSDGRCLGMFVNYPGSVTFDFGVEAYDKTLVEIDNRSAEIFIFKSTDIMDVVRSYFNLTGRTFLPPKWGIGHTISRYSYYPAGRIKEIVKRYRKSVPVEAVYLDIHFMDGYRLFTWNRERFGDGRSFLDEMHSIGVKVVTIVDPSVKMDQNYEVFRKGLGHFMQRKNGDIYHGSMWPGDSVFPDFMNSGGRSFWSEEIRQWALQGVDGIWLDMNEPTILTEDHLLDYNALHRLDDGSYVEHGRVRNAYPYFQCQATYEGLSKVSEKPFILSRSGYAGIQKYAAVWTGDNVSSWDDIRMQISIVCNLSISGVSVVGCDLGGFMGDSSPEMILAYYRMAMLFPLYRNHKTINGNDQEVFLLPSGIRSEIEETVELRYDLIDTIYSAIYRSHKHGVPTVTPVAYWYPSSNDAFYCDDQYILGDGLMYAPQIYRGTQERKVFIPEGRWLDLFAEKIIEGPAYIRTEEAHPLYLRENSCLVLHDRIKVFGSGKFELYLDDSEYIVESDGRNGRMTPENKKYSVEVLNVHRYPLQEVEGGIA